MHGDTTDNTKVKAPEVESEILGGADLVGKAMEVFAGDKSQDQGDNQHRENPLQDHERHDEERDVGRFLDQGEEKGNDHACHAVGDDRVNGQRSNAAP